MSESIDPIVPRASSRQAPPGGVVVVAVIVGLIGWLLAASYDFGPVL